MAETVKEIQTRVENVVKSFSPKWVTAQRRIFAAREKYNQLLSTHDSLDNDGADKSLTDKDRDRKPDDAIETWRQVDSSLDSLPCSVSCHVYDGPNGKGFFFILQVKAKDEIYIRAIDGDGSENKARRWFKREGLPGE